MKKRNKRINTLFGETIDEIMFFEFRFSLDGTLVKLRPEFEGLDILPVNEEIYIDEEGDLYPESETLVFEFTNRVRQEIPKTLRRLLKLRGVAGLETINFNHKEVSEAIATYKREVSSNVDDNTMERIREEVYNKYKPEHEIALYETVLLTMVERDLFIPSRTRRGLQMDERIAVEIPEDVCTSRSPEMEVSEKDDLFEKMKYGISVEGLEPIIRDQNNSLEYMIAIVDTLILENEALANIAQELAKVVVANVYIVSNREAVIQQGLEPFRRRLEGFLPEFMGNRNISFDWDNPVGRIPIVFGKNRVPSDNQEGVVPDSGSKRNSIDGSGQQSEIGTVEVQSD